jgi:endonuclease-8
VCFNAPVVELLLPSEEQRHKSLSGLGPDVLGPDEPFDFAEVRKRAALCKPDLEIGVLLLDQKVVSGIGNIYRCEALFADRRNPWTPQSALTPGQLDHLVETARNMMKRNVTPAGDRGRSFSVGGAHDPWVYGRANRPCRVCGTSIVKDRIGEQARDVFWCPKCQPSG